MTTKVKYGMTLVFFRLISKGRWTFSCRLTMFERC